MENNNYIENKSRVPLHAPIAGFSLSDFLNNLHNAYNGLFVEGHAPNDGNAYSHINALLAQELIKTSQPVKVAEIGCTNGRMSFHLANLLGRFHPESNLCCVCDSIGNESGNFWLDMISMVQVPPKLSLHASDYDNTNLRTNHFDAVIINGSVTFDNVKAVVKEARNLVKSNGVIICYAWRQPELAEYMKATFSHTDEYIAEENTVVLFASATNLLEEKDEIIEWKNNFQKDYAHAEALLVRNCEKEELMQFIQRLNHHADIATLNQIIDIKCKSITLKEKLLNKYIEL